jgi:hypothetical protein
MPPCRSNNQTRRFHPLMHSVVNDFATMHTGRSCGFVSTGRNATDAEKTRQNLPLEDATKFALLREHGAARLPMIVVSATARSGSCGCEHLIHQFWLLESVLASAI